MTREELNNFILVYTVGSIELTAICYFIYKHIETEVSFNCYWNILLALSALYWGLAWIYNKMVTMEV